MYEGVLNDIFCTNLFINNLIVAYNKNCTFLKTILALGIGSEFCLKICKRLIRLRFLLHVRSFKCRKNEKKMLDHIILESSEPFSLMFDESTSVSVKTCLILYIRTPYKGEIYNFLLNFIELPSQTGKDIAEALFKVLMDLGFTETILKERLIGICTDGASNLQGPMNGALALLKNLIDTDFVIFHCLAHKLELAIHDVLKTVTEVSHFQMFSDSLYSHFSRSPKNQNDLLLVAEALHVQLLKVGRAFDIRWVASSYRCCLAIWQSYPALVEHFDKLSSDKDRNAKDKAKGRGMCLKMKKWFFVAELAIILDALEVIRNLSLYFQKRQSSVRTANSEISVAIEMLTALKEQNGLRLKEFFDEFTLKQSFKLISFTRPSDAEFEKFRDLKLKFFQSLVDNISNRFSNDKSVLKHAAVLDKSNWPTNEELILYGDYEIMELRKLVKIETCRAAAIVHQFRLRKSGEKLEEKLSDLNELEQRLDILPISSAECERGFSSMNLVHTSVRNRLALETIQRLLFVKVNGPPFQFFDAETYSRMWIKEGHHSATDTASGIPKKTMVIEPQHNLFR